jgi:hypothetical protein
MLLISESFDAHNNPSDFYRHGPSFYDSGITATATPAGADGGLSRALTSADSSAAKYFRVTFDKQTHIVVGFALYYTGATYTNREICGIRAFDSGSEYLMGGVVLHSGVIKIVNNNNTTNFLASGSTLSASTWYYIEVKFTLGVSNGAIEVRVNGVSDCSVSNINTDYNTIGFVNRVYFGPGANSYYLDDVYICNLLGPAPFNDFLGPIYIKKLLPSGEGLHTDFAVSGALTKINVASQALQPTVLTNYLGINEDFAENLDKKQSFVFPGLAANYQILGVVQQTFMSGQLNPTESLQKFATYDTTTVSQSFVLQGSDSPWWITAIWPTDPEGNAWTSTKLQSTNFGLRIYKS